MPSRTSVARRTVLVLILVLGLGAVLCVPGRAPAKKPLIFAGGPIGGTFNYFATAMAERISKDVPGLVISNEGSGGSVANLHRLQAGEIDFAIVYSGDAYLARHGRLPGDQTRYDAVRAVSFLYAAPAHLVVRRTDNVTSVRDLAGRRVAVGNPGSGAATAARRFFTHLGLWDGIVRMNMGYAEAARAFGKGEIDAFWVFAGFPNSSVIEACASGDAVLLDLSAEAQASGFFEHYPFYAPMRIPAGTYRRQTEPVRSFQDAALWCTARHVDDDDVYRAVGSVFSPRALSDMVYVGTVAGGLSVDNAMTGVAIPVAPGAERFWRERGIVPPPAD